MLGDELLGFDNVFNIFDVGIHCVLLNIIKHLRPHIGNVLNHLLNVLFVIIFHEIIRWKSVEQLVFHFATSGAVRSVINQLFSIFLIRVVNIYGKWRIDLLIHGLR